MGGLVSALEPVPDFVKCILCHVAWCGVAKRDNGIADRITQVWFNYRPVTSALE